MALQYLLALGNTCSNNTRKLLLSDTKQHTNCQVQNTDHRKRKPGKEPKLNTDVLLGTRAATPVNHATLITPLAIGA